MNTKVNKEWHRKPNWYLYFREFIYACWYSDTKTQAKAVANAHVNAAKSRNKLKPAKLRIYKKHFVLKQVAKGVDDA